MKVKLLSLLLLIIFHTFVYTQTPPFNIYIEPMQNTELGGLQAYAYGQHNGNWLLIGGRLDGLHRRQPFASFDIAGNNNQIIVFNPITKQKWTAPLASLSTGLQEQLSSTNMEFYQDGAYLYIIGGYGYNNATASRKTFNNMAVINVPAVIEAVISGNPFSGFIRQITDDDFAVTGGQLEKINDTFYLIGGNRFDGNYNPMGNPTYTQAYTNAIRKFNLTDDGNTVTVSFLPPVIDTINLHRRDYNAVPQIFSDGSEGITAFSGVFQPTIDLPYLNCVNIDSGSYSVNNSFQQYYNHYHCAVLPVYQAGNNEMHTVFFGGIAQYYDSAGILVQDNNVPFVKTIARVTRSIGGAMAEYKLPVDMPELMGASAEFISLESVPHYNNGVLKLDDLYGDTALVGYIYGGINSSAPNIFFTNTGVQSTASSVIIKVYVVKNNLTSIHNLNKQSTGTLKLQLFPNPNNGDFVLKFYLTQPSVTKLSVFNLNGKKVNEKTIHNLNAGEHTIRPKFNLQAGTSYIISIETNYEQATQRFMVEP